MFFIFLFAIPLALAGFAAWLISKKLGNYLAARNNSNAKGIAQIVAFLSFVVLAFGMFLFLLAFTFSR